MSLSYPPVPYAPMSTSSTSPRVVRLLIPMPIPRTPNAPYFDERGVRAFLTLILQHGSYAGITDADELVSFIVRYSSDRVRAVIQYIPELDEDTPKRTWSAAEQQMLLLYGSLDEPRCVSEQELLEFCREQSAKPPFRSKFEVERYLRSFQYIAAPLLKQQDITIAQRDYYFVSDIPSAIKNWFILRVPEPQRTRSSPIPLADTLGILYDYFDPDALFPGLWDELDDFSEPAEPLVPSTEHRTSPLQSIPLTLAPFYSTIRLSTPLTPPAPPQETVSLLSPPKIKEFPHSSPALSTSSLLEIEPPSEFEPKQVHWDLDNAADLDQDFTTDEQLKVSPSDDEPLEDIIESGEREPDSVGYQYKGSAVDSSEEYSITDRVSGFCWALNQLKHLAARQDVNQASVADIARGIQAELEQCLTSASCGYVGLQISSHSFFDDNDSGSVSEMVVDVREPIDPWTTPTEINDDYERYLAREYDNIELSFADSSEVSDSGDITESESSSVSASATEFEDESLIGSYLELDNADNILDIGNLSFRSDVRVPEFVESSNYMQSIAVFDPMPQALSYSLLYEDFDAVFRPDGASLEHANVQQLDAPKFDLEAILELYTSVEPSQLSIPPPVSCFDPCSKSDSVTDLFIELFYGEKNAYCPSAPFPNNEPDPVTIYESADIPELSCFVHSATHSEFDSTTDLFLELFYADKNSSELSVAFIDHEQDAQTDFESYFTQDAAELSSIPHSTQLSSHPEPESTTHLFIELFYNEQNFPEPRNTSGDDERNLVLIYELYFDADISEQSSHFTFIHSISDSEPVSITDTYIELILSQETSTRVDSETNTPASERDSSTHIHANCDEDLCTIFYLYTEQHEYSSRPEPSKRAESQPFFSHTSYVHDFVSELLILRTGSHAFIEPTDDPPSSQESILVSEPSFAFAHPRIRAEFCANLLLHLFLFALYILVTLLRRFFCFIVLFFSELYADHNFDTIPDSGSTWKQNYLSADATAIHVERRPPCSIYLKNFILAEPRPPDKPSHFTSSHTPHFPTFFSIPSLKPLFRSDFEGEIQSTPLCGRVTWLAHRQDPSHAFQAKPTFIDKIFYYFLLPATPTFTDYFTSIASFVLDSIVISLQAHANTLARILQPNCLLQNARDTSSITPELLHMEFLHLFTSFYIYLSHILQTFFFFFTMYRQCDGSNHFGHLGLCRGSTMRWIGHPYSTLLRGSESPYHVFA